MLTYLAILFVILLVGAVFYGFSIVMRRPPSASELNSEPCSLCRNRFNKSQLVERQIGDYKVLYFCRVCITQLKKDANGLTISPPEN